MWAAVLSGSSSRTRGSVVAAQPDTAPPDGPKTAHNGSSVLFFADLVLPPRRCVCRRRSVAVEGWGGLWKGVSAAMWRAIPVNAAIFVAVEGTRQIIADTEDTVDAFVANINGKGEAAL